MIPGSKRYSPIGLDVGARAVKAVQCAFPGGVPTIHAAASIPRSTPGGDLSPPEAQRILATLRRQGFVGERAILSISPAKMFAAVMELPARSSGAPLDSIARQELARTCKRDPNSIELAWWELPTASITSGPARAGHGIQAMALGCAHADADALVDAFASTRLDVLAVDTPPTALTRACTPLAARAPNLTAILGLGYNAAQILILCGGTLVYERTLAEAGLRLLASGIANQLSSDAELTDFLLSKVGCADNPEDPNADQSREARALIGAHADALASELKTSIAYSARRFDAPLTRVLLTGSGADIPGLAARLSSRAGVDAITARADALCPAAPGLDRSLLGPGAALALGLALHGSTVPDAPPESASETHAALAAVGSTP